MERRIHPLTGLLSILAFWQPAASAAPSPERPHVIFVLADDMGAGDLGCYGGTLVPTPNIDRLAKEGTRFTRYYSASPICSPSRAGLITGQFPARWRITSYLQTRAGNRAVAQADFLDPQAPSLPRQLKAAGYATAHFGKWHLGGGRDVKDAPRFAAYGYDEHASTWESPQPHPDLTATEWVWSDKDKVKRWERSGFFVDRALEFLRRRKDAGPCFVNLWLDDPHTPWVPPAGAAQGDTPENLKGVLTGLDREVGRLLDGLRELGLERKTLVIFTSDNGPLPTFDGARTGGLRGSKLSLYEGGVRLPFIARWPGNTPAGRVDEQTVLAAVDVLPTLCALGGARMPDGVTPDGQDMTAALRGTPVVERKAALFWEYGRHDRYFEYPKVHQDRSPNLAVREGKWKLLVNDDGSRVELYDLSADPRETTELSARRPEVAAELTKRALAWRTSLP